MKKTHNMTKFLAALGLALAFALLTIGIPPALAEEPLLDEELEALLSGKEEHPVYHFPTIPPEYALTFGLGYGDIERNPAALRFYDEKGSFPVFGFEARLFEFPHRFYFVMESAGTDDLFGETRYAYGDTLIFRWVGVKLHRDVEYMRPTDTDPGTANPTVWNRDPNFTDFGVTRYMETMYLRLKAPDYASHLYLKYFFIHREGDMQERSLQGSAWFNNLVLVTERKHIDWHSAELTYGLNSHLGPVEAEVSQTATAFTVEGEPQSFGQYSGTSLWAPGAYPHHLTPEFAGLSSSLLLHTSYTGKLVAAASLTAKDLENNTSGASADYLIGTGNMIYQPLPELAFILKYRLKEMQTEAPAFATITDYSGSHWYIYGLKEPLDSREDDLTFTARGRLAHNLALTGEYKVERTDRDNAEIWGLPSGSMKKQTASLGLKLTRTAGFDLAASLKYSSTDNPAYNTDADTSRQVTAQAGWSPTEKLSALASYRGSLERRGSLEYSDTTLGLDRVSARDTGLLSVTYMPVEGLSVTGGYSVLYGVSNQDLVYLDSTGTPMVAPGVLYRDKSQCYSLNVGVVPSELLSLDLGLNYNWNDGHMESDHTALSEVAGLLDYKFAETAVTLGGKYKLDSTLSLNLTYKYADLDEKIGSSEDGLVTGSSQWALLTLTKKW